MHNLRNTFNVGHVGHAVGGADIMNAERALRTMLNLYALREGVKISVHIERMKTDERKR